MTDWETTKIKGDVKERAKDDPRTYTEIMEAGLEDSKKTENVSPMREELRKDRQEQLENVVHACTADAATTEDIADLVEEINSLSKRLTDSESVTLDATERKKIAEAIAEELR